MKVYGLKVYGLEVYALRVYGLAFGCCRFQVTGYIQRNPNGCSLKSQISNLKFPVTCNLQLVPT